MRLFRSALVWVFALAAVGCAHRGPDSLNEATSANADIKGTILSLAPPGWTIVETKDGEIPPGHASREPGYPLSGRKLVLAGPQDVYFTWWDKLGEAHRELWAKESLELWIMPPEYRDKWTSSFNPHRHVPPERFYAGPAARVYGRPSHFISNRDGFNSLILKLSGVAAMTGWPGSPRNGGPLSWPSWRQDLEKGLEAAEPQ